MLALNLSSSANDWPGWRGATGVGLCDERDLLLKWDGKSGEGIVWKVPLDQTTGHSSPIVWGDHLFLTTAAKQTRQQESSNEVPAHHLFCYKASDGQLLWQTAIPQGKQSAGYAIYAVPTPITDGNAVYCWFGSSVVAAVDFEGKLIWRQELAGPFNLNPGICSSPSLYGDTVILLQDQGKGQGWLQALDKKTGQVKWEQKRPKTGHSNTTPLILQIGEQAQLVTAGGNLLQGLDPASGEPIWSCKSVAFGASPAYGSGLLCVFKGGNEPAQAVDPTGRGDVAKTHVKWQMPKVAGDYSSPVVSGEYVYNVRQEGVIGCIKLATGEEMFTERLAGVSKLASPFTTPDGRVYFVSAGKSYVLKVGATLEVIGGGDLGQSGNGSSPAVSGGRIFVRGTSHLFALGPK
jgi:outer membrane protein assembly factor BamB